MLDIIKIIRHSLSVIVYSLNILRSQTVSPDEIDIITKAMLSIKSLYEAFDKIIKAHK